MKKPILPVVAGATASGKTACAIALCRLVGGEVISADSMQIYQGMDILSAKPTPAEMGGVVHHMIGIQPPSQRYSADAFREDANRCIARVIEAGHMPVLCGGTGLYINAVTRPMSFSLQSDEAMHDALMAEGVTPEGRQRLHDELSRIDPEAAGRLHPNDVRRVARAIEIYRLTGITQTEHSRRDQARVGDYREVLFAPDWPREALYARIDHRVDEMLARGLIDEVRALLSDEETHPTAAQAIGYKEIAEGLRGNMPMERAIFELRKATRNYAKRQLTWFRRDARVIWLPAQGRTAQSLAEEMLSILKERFGNEIPRGE